MCVLVCFCGFVYVYVYVHVGCLVGGLCVYGKTVGDSVGFIQLFCFLSDPVECIASACVVYETGFHMMMEPGSINRAALGRAVLQYTRLALDKAFESLKVLETKMKVVHVRYSDSIKSPKDICRRVTEAAGLEFSAEYEGRVDSYIQKNASERTKKLKEAAVSEQPQPQGGQTRLEEYGLTPEGVRDMFADYTDVFRLVDFEDTSSLLISV